MCFAFQAYMELQPFREQIYRMLLETFILTLLNTVMSISKFLAKNKLLLHFLLFDKVNIYQHRTFFS